MPRAAALVLVGLVDAALIAALFETGRRVLRLLPRSCLPVLAAAAIAAGALLVESPYAASNCSVSDSVEYLTVAKRFFEGGSPDLPIEGREVPSRFPIWFSVLFLSPMYALFGGDIGSAVIAVTAFALLGVVAVCAAGCMIASPLGGAGAAALVLLSPGYRYFGRQVLTDVPAAALAAAAALLWLTVTASADKKRAFAAAGVLAACAAAMRPLMACLILPFYLRMVFRRDERSRASFVLLTAPLAVVLAATLYYQGLVFGDPLRTGYQLWTAVPYDFPGLVLSWRYLPANLRVLAEHTLVLPCAFLCAVLLVLRRHGAPPQGLHSTSLRAAAFFVLLAGSPPVLVHLVYFYQTSRFYLPFELLLAVPAGALAGAWLARHGVRMRHAVTLFVVVAAAGAIVRAAANPPSAQREAADLLGTSVPAGALVVSGLNPVYLQEMLGGGRQVVPVSRRVEFASKVLSWQKPAGSAGHPRDWREHRAPFLKAAGAEEAFTHTAVEDLAWLRSEAALGRTLYLEERSLTDDERGLLSKAFFFEPVAPGVVQLRLRSRDAAQE